MVTTFATISIVIGAVLGLRFTILMLAAAIVFGTTIVFVVGMAQNDSHWLVLPCIILAIATLQLGYLAGAVIRSLVAKISTRKTSAGAVRLAQKSVR